MSTQQEVIKTFMQSLNNTTLKGGKALDEAFSASSDYSDFDSLSEVKTQFLSDLNSAKNWHAFLVEKCGIILDNADTGAISGSDAGGSKTKSATDILPSTGKASYPEGRSFTVGGLTIYGVPSQNLLTDDQQYVIKGLYSWWLRDALALIKESYGFSFTDAGTTNARLKLKFVDEPDEDYLAYVSFEPIDDNGKTYESRVLCVNMKFFENMSDSNRHGSTDSAALDRVLVHELVHGLMASNVNYFGDLPGFLKEGGSAELIHGLDDENYDDIISYAKDPSVFETILTTVEPDEVPYEAYTGGYIFMRYYAKQAADDTTFSYDTRRPTVSVKNHFATNYHDTVTMKGGSGNDTITNSGYKVSITAGSGNDVIKTYSDTVTVSAGNGADFMFNEGSKVTMLGGKGNDTVNNEGDSVKASGGTGNDLFNNKGSKISISGGDGKDRITNNISGFETIEAFTEQELEEGVQSTNGVTVTSDDNYFVANVTGGNNSTLKGGAGNDTLANYASKVKMYGDAGVDAITNYGFNATIYGGTGNDIILNDFSEVSFDDDTVYVTGYQAKIYGGDGNDSITNTVAEVAIYGEKGANTIRNSGDDTSIYGGASADDVENDGNSAYISLGAGADVFENSASSVIAFGDAGGDEFINFGDESTLSGGADNDDFYNYGDTVSIAGGAGKDYIYNSGEVSSLIGGDGIDSIYNDGVNVYVSGGAGNDDIYNYGDHVTIAGGSGNDYIENEGKHITYNFGASNGNDTLFGFNANDTIKITSGTHSAKKSGSNVIVTVGNSTMTIADAVGKKINFISAAGKKTTKTFSAKMKTSSKRVSKKILSADLFADDNFITSDNFSAIVKPKDISASFFDVDFNSSTSLTNKKSIVTYSGKK